MKNYKYKLLGELFGIYSKCFAGHDFKKDTFFWRLGYKNVCMIFDYKPESDVCLELWCIPVEIDFVRPYVIELHRIIYKGEFNEKE